MSLLVVDVSTNVSTAVLLGSKLTIGRDKKSGIVLSATASGVSRTHAIIEWKSKDEVLLTDCSTYGTFVHGSSVTGRTVAVFDLDEFCVGEATFRIRFIKASSPVPPKLDHIRQNPIVQPMLNISRSKGIQGSSQKKVSDFFARPSIVNESSKLEVLAEDTPSILLKSADVHSQRGSISMVADSMSTTSRSHIPSAKTLITLDDDDDFAMPTKRSGPAKSKKSSLLSGKPVPVRDVITFPVIAEDTSKDDICKSESAEGDNRSNSFVQESICSVQANISTRGDNESMLSSLHCPPNRSLLLEDVHSQMHISPIANSTQVSAGRTVAAKKGRKRSAFLPPPSIAKNEDDIFVEPLSKRNAAAMFPPDHFILSGSAQTEFVSDSFNQPKRRGRPPTKPLNTVEAQNVKQSTDFDRTDPNILLSMVCSGKKYEDDDVKDSQSEYKPSKIVKEADVERVVKNMDRMVVFADLTRSATPSCSASSFRDRTSTTMDSSMNTNFKRFKKANQGKFNTSLSNVRCVLGGSEDLVDFRKVAFHN